MNSENFAKGRSTITLFKLLAKFLYVRSSKKL